MHKNEVYYLGIEDKNGKELTSNSVINFDGQKGYIFYSIDDCRFKIKWEDGYVRGITKSFINSTEIV